MDYENVSAEERVASLFQPDTLLAEQYLSGNKSKQLDPGKRLMLAVLEDAVLCFRDNVATEDPRKKALFRDAELWIMEESTDGIFSFASVCDALGLNPEYVRTGLLTWKERSTGKGRRCAGKKKKAA